MSLANRDQVEMKTKAIERSVGLRWSAVYTLSDRGVELVRLLSSEGHPMSRQKLFPRPLTATLCRGLDPLFLQNIADSLKSQHMTKIRQRSLNPAIAPTAIFLSQSSH